MASLASLAALICNVVVRLLLVSFIAAPDRVNAVALPLSRIGDPQSHVIRANSSCEQPLMRTEWRRLSDDQKDSYIAAVQCMLQKPSVETPAVPAAINRYEDFVATHVVDIWNAHFVGAFYPWHRWLLSNFEQELQACGFSGGLPYWDWTLDTASEDVFLSSPIFDAVRGFGGNGQYVPENLLTPAPTMFLSRPKLVANRTGGGCLVDGPFAGLSTQLGPRDNIRQLGRHCVTRDLGYVYMRNTTDTDQVLGAMDFPNFGIYGNKTEYSYHSGGHWAIGGDYATMSDMWISLAMDPIFFLHHSNLDRAWWSWQTRDLDARIRDISGPLFPQDYHNKEGGNYTLDSVIHIGITKPKEVMISEVMHIQRGPLCYTFDQLY
ncbi:hypothetical protein SCAR479_08074 [Seiridium cardinale]|uniref:Tyrosinase copper-binding domain-containing protein n=1 Tax=Seiridium cardinale TaxID=138064 RepID=A0ABR2XMR7_9PEZI